MDTDMNGPAPSRTRLMFRFLPSVKTSAQVASPTSRSFSTDAITLSRSAMTLASSEVALAPCSRAKMVVASSTRPWAMSQRGDSGRKGKAQRMMMMKKAWKAIGNLHPNDDGSAWELASPMKVLRG